MSWKDHSRASLAIQAMIHILESEGIDPDLCLEGSGLKSHEILDVEAKISNTQEIAIIEKALDLLPAKAGYGIKAGRSLRITHFGVWGLALITSPDMRSAFETIVRFSELSVLLSKVSFREDHERVSFIVDMAHLPTSIHRFMFERYFSGNVSFLREVTPDYDFSGLELHLPFSDPVYEHQLASITGLRVLPRQNCFAISAPKELLDTPFPQTDPIAHAHFVAECEKILNQHRELPNYAERVRSYIVQEQQFSPRLSDVAKFMCISDRTLRRRLQEEQQSFHDIVLATKMTLAKELLLTTGLAVKVVATRLDYSESASFVRAFKKWWGMTPAEIKRTR